MSVNIIMLSDLVGVGVMTAGLTTLILVVALWDLIWKGIALWKCGRNNQIVWFVFVLILNTVGILPIIYLLFFQKKNGNFGKKKRR